MNKSKKAFFTSKKKYSFSFGNSVKTYKSYSPQKSYHFNTQGTFLSQYAWIGKVTIIF